MADSVSLIVAVVILFLVFRWVLGSNSNGSVGGDTNNRGQAAPRRRNVTPDMVETVKNLFPHVSTAAIQADLALTGSVEVTCEKIITRGGLPTPAHILNMQNNLQAQTTSASTNSQLDGNNLTQRNVPGTQNQTMDRTNNLSTSSTQSNGSSEGTSLVDRYQIKEVEKLEEKPFHEPEKVWTTDSNKRQEMLLNRKKFMIMEARRKFLEKQKKSEASQSNNQNNKTS